MFQYIQDSVQIEYASIPIAVCSSNFFKMYCSFSQTKKTKLKPQFFQKILCFYVTVYGLVLYCNVGVGVGVDNHGQFYLELLF